MFNSKALALTLSIISSVVYLFCALVVSLAPEKSLNFFKYIFHGVDITLIAKTTLNWPQLLLGLAQVFLYSLIVGWLFGEIYNFLCHKFNK